MTLASLGFSLQQLNEVDSTNKEAVRQACAGVPTRTIIMADHQTAGKGRDGRTWLSEPGNLQVSWIERLDMSPVRASQLVYVVALAVVEALVEQGVHIQLKWPNDLLLEGKKLGGILLESGLSAGRLDYVVIGLGINIAHIPKEVEQMATCLPNVNSVDLLLERILLHYTSWLSRFDEEGVAPVIAAWSKHAAFMGQEIVARTSSESMTGIMRGIDGQGALLLETNDGMQHISVADIMASV